MSNLPINFLILKPKDPIPNIKIEGLGRYPEGDFSVLDGKTFVILKNDGISQIIYGPLDWKQPTTWQFIPIPENYRFENPYVKIGPFKIPCFWLPSCRNFCGHHLRRWHLTCLTKCRFRQIIEGKRSPIWPVEVFMLYRRENRRGYWWKNRALKYVWSLLVEPLVS